MVSNTVWIVLIAAVIVGAAIVLIFWYQRHRSRKLQARFGPEYGRALKEAGSARRAEAQLEQRTKRVEKLDIHPLSPEDRARFSEAWANLQRRFVDSPEKSVAEADGLVRDVMVARGYPMADFERRAEDISVHYPHVVKNYRAARAVAERSSAHQATTEELRQAVVYYRSLFEELLEAPEPAKRRIV